MPIISVEIMKTIAEREKQKTTKEKQTKTKKSKENRSYRERVRARWFWCTFKLGFLQLIRKASLIFKLNLELALSIILKQIELYESKHVYSGVQMSKNMRLVSSILVLKWRLVSPI